MNTIVPAVARIGGRTLIVWIGLTLLLTGSMEKRDEGSLKPVAAHTAGDDMGRRLQNMAHVAGELKSSSAPGKAGQQVGELWIQTEHLKREGMSTKNVEGLLSDLEWNLRRSQQDPGARRHLANELGYEIAAMKRRDR